MLLIDWILNIAGLLLWFSWRAQGFDPITSRRPATLIGTLRPADAAKSPQWLLASAVPLIILIRTLFYWQLGGPADWVPKLDLGIVVAAFKVDDFASTLLFSACSFVRVALIGYFWMITISVVNGPALEPDPVLRLIRLQLGFYTRLPRIVQFILPLLLVIVLWIVVQPLLVATGVMGQARAESQVVLQGALLSGCLLLTLKILLPVLLLLYLVTTYVYLGASPLWDMVTNTGRKIVSPIGVLPVRMEKFDFSPIVAIILILLLLHGLPELLLRIALNQGWSVWPD